MQYLFRFYSLPLLLAAAVHLMAVGTLYVGWNPIQREAREIKPRLVQSQLIVMQPKPRRTPRAAPVAAPAPPVETLPAPEQSATPEPEEPAVDPLEEEREALERQRQRLAELARQSFDKALEFEASEIAEGEEEAAAASIRFGIYQRVVANWSRPPSARNGMQAKLLVELIPTGEVVAVTVLESSGNAAFDRSAEAAVRNAGDFEVPRERDIFERYFRRFSLLFRPEDLLR